MIRGVRRNKEKTLARGRKRELREREDGNRERKRGRGRERGQREKQRGEREEKREKGLGEEHVK